MKTLLLLWRSLLINNIRYFSAASLLVTLLCISGSSRAQVYLTTAGATTSTEAGDGLVRVGYNGTGFTTLASSVAPTTVATDIDYVNNRAFIFDNTNKAIKVVNSGNGSTIATITVPNSNSVTSIKYDAASGFIYYLTLSNTTGNSLQTDDALRKVKPDGSSDQLVISSIANTPQAMTLDLANNQLFIIDSFGTSVKLKRIVFGSDPTSSVSTTIITQTKPILDIAYNPIDKNVYILNQDGSYLTKSAEDAIKKVPADAAAGTAPTVVATSIGYAPNYVAFDFGNDRAFFYEAATASNAPVKAKLMVLTLSTGVVSSTPVLDLAGNTTIAGVNALNVPQVAKLTTATVSGVGSTTATLGGAISASDMSVTSRGVVYSSSNQTPVIGGSGVTQAANGSGTGSFSATIGSLSGSTTYYARAYATSSAGTSYGDVQTFTTQSNDATLSALTISAGSLNPGFNASTIGYTATVANANSTVTITPTKNNAGASIQVNNVAATSGSGSTVNLSIGDNAIPVKVTAADGTTTKTYTITFTRPKAAQTITFASTATKTFGDADFAPGASASSGLGVSYSSDNTAVATIVSGQIHIVSAGTANITASQAGDANNAAASNVVQVLTVNKASQTITFNTLPAKTYGNADFAPGATATSGLNVTYSSDNTAVATIVSNQIHIVGQGTANITAVQTGNSNYNAATNATQTLSVAKANLTITANAQTKIYGADDPTFTYTATGVVNGDAPTGTLSRVSPNTNRYVGTYAIDLGTLSYGNNYNASYSSANLTINKRPVTVLPVAKTKVYGDPDPFLNAYSFAAGSSLAPGDGSSSAFGRAEGENVGTYLMTFGNKIFVSGSSFVDVTANYDITVQPAYVTITAKPVTVSAYAQTKTYGDADPTLTYSNDGLAFSDTFSGSLTRATGEGIGTYAITKGTLALNSNYTLTFNGNSLTIGKKTVNVTANAKTKTYGAADPALDYTADALAFSDSFTGSLTRVSGENAGTYAISQGSLALSSNYTLNFTGADLNIGTKAINVTANAATKTYGEADPDLTYNADALVSGDAFTGSLSRTAGETAGSYPITQGSLALNSNYVLNYTGANLNIGKRDITVNAYAQNVPYGDADVTIGYNTTGNTLVTGDVLSGVLGREPGTAVGTYAITQNTLTISNSSSYNVNFVTNSYNIIARPITITSPFKTKIYGDADPLFTYSVTSGSLLPGDAVSGTLVRDAGENSGPYTVRQGTVAVNNPNYNVTYNLNNFEIDRAPLTVKADDKTKLVGAPNPTFTYTITGLKNGDNESAFYNPIMFQNLPLSSAPAGTYDIYFTDTYAANYNVTTQSGILTVRNPSADATLSSLTIAEGTLTPAFDPETTTYSASVGADVNQVNITGVLADAHASLYRINGFDATSGQPSTVNVYPGDNQISVYGIAEDLSTTKEYIINISKPLDTNAKLNGIALLYGEHFDVVPGFTPDVHDYTLNVPAEITSARLIPFTANQYSRVSINGTPYEGFYGSGFMSGDNHFTFDVTAQDGVTTESYTLNIIRALSTNNKLWNITLSAGTLSPAFDTDVLHYTATVAGNVASIDVQGFTADTTARYKVNGNILTDRYQPYTVALAEGQNTITLEVTAKNGDIRNYVLEITRPEFPDIKLQSLAINTGTLTPAFAPGTLTYDVLVPNSVETMILTPVAAVNTATVQVGATTINASAPTATVNLIAGLNNVNVVVTAADGISKQTYLVRVSRGLSDNTSADIKISPTANLVQVSASATDVYYTCAVAPNVTSITLTPKARNIYAMMQVNGSAIASDSTSAPITLNMGPTVVNLVVTAQNGVNTRVYHITVNRVGSNVANLLTLKLTPTATLTKGAVSATDINYTCTVAPSVNSVMLTSVLQDLNSTMKVNGVTVASGAASNPIALNIGQTVINVVVTAQDGVTTRAYHVAVSRTGSNIANATTLRLTPTSTLVKGTATLTDVNYTCTVSPSVNSVTLTSILQDENATMKVNGSAVANNVASAPIPLNIGETVINLVVTAQDGVTTRAYHITVSRTGSSIANATILRLTPASTLVKGSVSLTEVNYSTTTAASTGSVTLTATAQDLNSTMTINGMAAVSGSPSATITLGIGQTVIELVVTAQDGVTKRTYFVTVNRPAPTLLAVDKADSKMFTNKTNNNFAPTGDDGVVVHQGVSPNGDGFNDFLVVEGLTSFTGSKLSIMNTSGTLVFDMKDYGKDGSRVFDGHAKNGNLLNAGTYYYTLEYNDGSKDKRKTGYIILKY